MEICENLFSLEKLVFRPQARTVRHGAEMQIFQWCSQADTMTYEGVTIRCHVHTYTCNHTTQEVVRSGPWRQANDQEIIGYFRQGIMKEKHARIPSTTHS